MDTEDAYERVTGQRREDRIRTVLGLGGGSSLPPVDPATLRKYHHYLAWRLTFPFEAQYSAEAEPLVYPVTVVGLVDPADAIPDPMVGLCCVSHVKNKLATLPLVDMEVAEDSPNFRILDDYWYWLWNWREFLADSAPRAGKRQFK
jgi:hypothetical protein